MPSPSLFSTRSTPVNRRSLMPISSRSSRAIATAALALAGALALLPATAEACGGFFCNLQDPIAQAAERVLYLQEGKRVTAHIQITYAGPASGFSWVLPLQKQPKLGIGSDSIFAALEQATRPQYYLQQEANGNCHFNTCYAAMSASGADSGAGGGTKSAGVTVLAQEAVGPYDTVVLKGDSGAEVQAWLEKNGYGQPPSTKVLLDHYAKKEFVFLALKLQAQKDVKDLQPIVVAIDEVGPCLPLRLTGLAANPDMPIIIWALGQHRSIPKNWLHVQLNEKTIDWWTGGGNYDTVASKAIDQASGHAFLTEFAGKSSLLKGQLAQDKWDTAKLEKLTDPAKFLMAMLEQQMPRTSQTQEIIRKAIPKPTAFATETDQAFYGCVQSNCCVDKCEANTWKCDTKCADIKQAVAGQVFDPVATAKAIETGVVAPLREVQKAFDSLPYLTRLYTRVSPEEMDKDPIFAWNPDLPEVSNLHTAKALPVCPAGSTKATMALLTFADGSTMQSAVPESMKNGCMGGGIGLGGFGGAPAKKDGPIITAGGQPARVVEVLDESGPGLVIDPTVADKVDAQLNLAEIGKPSLPKEFILNLPKVTWNADSPVQAPPVITEPSGCTASPKAGSFGGLAVGLLALALLAVRRRQVPLAVRPS